MKIFVGSSSEARNYAEDVVRILEELGEKPLPWWDSLPKGRTLLQGLEIVVRQCDAGIFVASEDDVRVFRGEEATTPRDNVLFEYGWFVGRFGRDRTVLATLGRPELPTDLGGLNPIELDTESNGRNDSQIEKWLTQARLSNFGMDAQLSSDVRHALRLDGVRAIHAVDVAGPDAWANPQTYRYVAHQFRKYIDVKGNPGYSTLLLSPKIWEATDQAIRRATDGSLGNLRRSQSFLASAASGPKSHADFEVSRMLLWTREELVTPIGQGVVEFHETFHVPLFFLERTEDHADRRVDYLFVERTPGELDVYFGHRSEHFATKTQPNAVVPPVGDVQESYAELLADEGLLLANDAVDLFKE